MRLGALAIPTANALRKRAQEGAPPGSGGYRAPTTGRSATPLSSAIAGTLSSLFGEVPGGLAASGLQILTPILQNYGVNLSQPVQMQYGHSWRQALRETEIAASLQAQAQSEQLRAMKRGLDSLNKRLEDSNAPVWLRQPLNMLSDLAGDPRASAVVGPVLQVLQQHVPQIGQVLQQLEPGLITDYSPLVHAHLRQNEGEVDPPQLDALVEQFRAQYAYGAYPDGVPAQTAAFSLAFAADRGLSGEAMFEASKQISMAADTIMEAQLAPTFGQAMLLAQQLDNNFVRDPSRVIGMADSISAYAQKHALSPQMLSGVMQQAAEQGMNPMIAVQAYARSSELGQQFDPSRQASYLDTTNQLMGSHRVNTLGKLWALHPQMRGQIDQALESGDSQTLDNIYRRWRSNAQLRRLDPSAAQHFARRISQLPGAAEGLMDAELRAVTGDVRLTDADVQAAREGDYTSSSLRRLYQAGGDKAINVALARRLGGQIQPAAQKKPPVTRFGMPTPNRPDPVGVSAPDVETPGS